MSRIGKKPILIPEKVDVKIDNDFVIVKGPKGELKQKLIPEIKLNFSDDKKELNVDIKNKDVKKEKALWGTFRQLINNMIIGVTEGFEKKLEINGVGYKAVITGKTGSASGGELVLNVGFSHPVNFKIPENIDIAVEKNLITISGIDKQLVGETAAQIRKIKKPEPYKGKGIKYVDEIIRRKAGKQAKGATQ
ncbi:50S ribosomal protein L6 [Patescibacteria group bacterium]|nr:50S ribosomal protein L6 [Patescibacteria group bacterium]